MVVVAGYLRLDPEARQPYLDDMVDVMRLARLSPGCVAFHLSADALEPDRINIYEEWESESAVEAFRGSGPSNEQGALIEEVVVTQYEVRSARHL